MTKKLPKTRRHISVITAEIEVVLKREIADVILLGGLLCEAKRQIDHGSWLEWLEGEFSLSERSAQKYMRAHRWAAKSAPDADLSNLSPSALYLMSENPVGIYTPEVVAAILKEAAEKRIDSARAADIALSLLPAEAEPEPEPEKPEPKPESDPELKSDADAKAVEEMARSWKSDRWTETVLDPDPDLDPEVEARKAAEAKADLSRVALGIFKDACESWLPKMNAADFAEALHFVGEIAMKSTVPA